MAVSLKPAQGVVVVVAAAGTPVAPATLVPDNCHTLIVYNTAAAATVLVGWAPSSGTFVTADAVRVPPGASATLAIGVQSARPAGGAGGVANQLFIDATANGTTANLTYVNGVNT
jgi:hypothetical protein